MRKIQRKGNQNYCQMKHKGHTTLIIQLLTYVGLYDLQIKQVFLSDSFIEQVPEKLELRQQFSCEF